MKKTGIVASVLILTAAIAMACNVPVYRYALERWPSDPYRLAVVHDTDLAEDQQALIDELDALNESYAPALYIDTVDTRGEVKQKHIRTWLDENPEEETPYALMFYPSVLRVDDPFLQWPLNRSSVDLIKQSPVRQEIARAILKNATAAWLFIRGDDPAQNEQVRAMVRETLDEMEKTLKLNESFLQEMEMYGQDADFLKIQFPIIEMDKNDPNEKLLWTLLSELHSDVADTKEPILIPVYGRGRAMAIMLNEYIKKDYIVDACYYITGACSCEIKAGNPGFDIFIPVPWDELIVGELVVDQALPPLTGVSSALKEAAAAEPDETADIVAVEPEGMDAPAEEPPEEPAEKTGSPFITNIIIIAAAAVGVILFGTLLLGRRKE